MPSGGRLQDAPHGDGAELPEVPSWSPLPEVRKPGALRRLARDVVVAGQVGSAYPFARSSDPCPTWVVIEAPLASDHFQVLHSLKLEPPAASEPAVRFLAHKVYLRPPNMIAAEVTRRDLTTLLSALAKG